MKDIKKKRAITISIVVFAVVALLLGVAYAVTESFVLSVAMHVYVDLLMLPVILALLRKFFKDQLKDSMGKAFIWCSAFMVVYIIVDAVRYVLSHGGSTILFLPVYLPLCFIVIMLYSAKDTGRDKRAETLAAWLIGIPLLLLSLYFEVYSFLQI